MAEKIDAKPSNLTPEAFLEHFWKCSTLKRQLDEANGEYRAALKAAKTAGINQSMMIAIMKARKTEPDKVAMDLRDFNRYAAWIELPIGTQLGLFGDDIGMPSAEAAAQHNVHEARDTGIRAGRRGDNRASNPHAEGTEMHVAWDEGWLHGQARIAAEMEISGEEPKKPKAAKASRGRKAKSGNPEDRPAV